MVDLSPCTLTPNFDLDYHLSLFMLKFLSPPVPHDDEHIVSLRCHAGEKLCVRHHEAVVSSITSFPTISSSPIGDVVCSMVDCGQGTCKASNDTMVGYDCECYPGWAKPVVGPVTFPSCFVPNCTLNLDCTGGAPSPQPFPVPLPLPPRLNISDRSLGSDCYGLHLPLPPSPSEALSPLSTKFSSPAQHGGSFGSSFGNGMGILDSWKVSFLASRMPC
ncbi:hypothetical protein LguiB_011645 [Lonicera macranthoides]